MEDSSKIREALLLLYKEIKNSMPNDKRLKSLQEIFSCSSITLINIIKDIIPQLMGQKSFGNYDEKNKDKLLIDYIQLENQIRKLELDNKYNLKNYLIYQRENESLNEKMKSYGNLEEEHEKLKEKLKFEAGRFLENERKENEIIILRTENSKLKQEISTLETTNKNNEAKYIDNEKMISELKIKNNMYESQISKSETLIKEYENKIKEYEEKINDLNAKVKNLEKNLEENEIKYRGNLTINNYGLKYKNAINKIMGTPLFFSKDMNKANNFKKRKIANLFSLKKEIIYLDCDKNSNSKIIQKYNKIINDSKIVNNTNKEHNLKEILRNNSVSILREIEENKNKTIYKSEDKNYNNKPNLINLKSYNFFPLSIKNSNIHGQIVRKYIQKEFKKNSSSQNFESDFNLI